MSSKTMVTVKRKGRSNMRYIAPDSNEGYREYARRRYYVTHSGLDEQLALSMNVEQCKIASKFTKAADELFNSGLDMDIINRIIIKSKAAMEMLKSAAEDDSDDSI